MFHVVKTVIALDDFVLDAVFEDGTVKHYDVKQLFGKYPIFDSLKESPELFTKIKVDGGGFGVSWNGNLDLASEELWNNGITV